MLRRGVGGISSDFNCVVYLCTFTWFQIAKYHAQKAVLLIFFSEMLLIYVSDFFTSLLLLLFFEKIENVLQNSKLPKQPNKLKWRLDSNIESKSSNNTYLNIIEIFNKVLKKINIIKLRNLVVTSTSKKKGNFKCIRKFTSVT